MTTLKQRKLLTNEDAEPATHQHKRPCTDCPWARTALNGWTGAYTPAQWLQLAHAETSVECHVHLTQQCAGLAIYRANVGKLPRAREILQLPKNKQAVFATPFEYDAHHKMKGTK